MKNTRFTLGVVILLIFNMGAAQNVCSGFLFDVIEIDNAVITATEIPSTPNIPVIEKLDFDGQTIWSINDNIGGYENLVTMELYHFNDDFLYVLLTIAETHANSSRIHQVWKVDQSAGSILWKTDLYETDRDGEKTIFDYDTDEIVFINTVRNNNGGSHGGIEVIKFDRATGAETHLEQDLSINWYFRTDMDSKGNLYYTSRLPEEQCFDYGSKIRKLNGINLKQVIWEKDYPGCSTPSLEEPDFLLFDKFDNLYVSSTENNFDLFRINPLNGEEIWSINNLVFDYRLSDMEFRGGYMYLSYRHLFVGGGSDSWIITKIDIETGNIEWNSIQTHTLEGTPTSHNGNHESVLGFNFDCNGDIIATGYYGAANYGPAAWGVMKLDGTTGDKISDLTITNNLPDMDFLSSGYEVFLDNNNNPVIFGNLQYSLANAARAIVKVAYDLSTVDQIEYPCIIDTDSDGVSDFDEDIDGVGYVDNDDTDGNGVPNYLDDDDDGDTVDTILEINGIGAGFGEFYQFIDTDNDFIENYLDDDDDGDNVLTVNEDYNGNGDPVDDDLNNNSIPDFLDDLVPNPSTVTANPPTPLELCDEAPNDGFSIFDLTVTEPEIVGSQTGLIVTWHESAADATSNTNAIGNPASYQNLTNPQVVHARATDPGNNNFDTVGFQISVIPTTSPVTPTPMEICDDDGDGFAEFNLNDKDAEIIGGEPNVSISYHESQSDAQSGVNPLASPFTNTVPFLQTIYARSESNSTGCFSIVPLDLVVLVQPEVLPVTDYVVFDPNGDGIEVFDLTTKIPELLGNQNPADIIITFHTTMTGAVNSTNPIPNPESFTNSFNPQPIFVRLEFINTGCFSTNQFDLIADPNLGSDDQQYGMFKLFPNPTTGNVRLISQLPMNGEVNVYDVQGREIWSKSLPDGTEEISIDLSSAKSGVYFVEYVSGQNTVSLKLIKQ